MSVSSPHLDILIFWRSEADAVLLVNVGGLKVAEGLPDQLVVLLLEESHLDVVFGDLVNGVHIASHLRIVIAHALLCSCAFRKVTIKV